MTTIKNILTKVFFPLVLLALGIVAGMWFLANPEEARKRPKPEPQAFLVEVEAVKTGAYTVEIEAMGQVKPAVEANLKPQIAGEIIEVAEEFVPGGHFKKEDTILSIDPEDYRLALQRQEAILKQAEADYKLEMGRQSVARDELEILARTTGKKLDNPELALRAPQLEQATAELEKARTELEKAKLDLRRTVIKAPFNALITTREAMLGDKVSAQETLAVMVSTDAYWIELAVPVHDLKWLVLPAGERKTGSPATIFMDGGRGTREGYLLKLTGSLDQESRLAGVLIGVPDPLLLNGAGHSNKMPLILGDYVKVVLKGRTLQGIVRIPLTWLRDEDVVWVTEEGVLRFRRVQIIYKDRAYAYIREGLSSGDRVITSDIAVPVEGMKVRTMEESGKSAEQQMPGAKEAQKQ